MPRYKYFRIVGIIGLMSFILGLFFYTFYMFSNITEIKDPFLNPLLIIGLIEIIIFGPSVPLLFLAVADLIEVKEVQRTKETQPKKTDATQIIAPHVTDPETLKQIAIEQRVIDLSYKIGDIDFDERNRRYAELEDKYKDKK